MADVNRGEIVLPGVPGRIAVDPKQVFEHDRQAGFFFDLAPGRILQGLAVVHKASRKRPADGLVPPFDEHNAALFTVVDFDDDIDRRVRISGSGHGFVLAARVPACGRFRAPEVCSHIEEVRLGRRREHR